MTTHRFQKIFLTGIILAIVLVFLGWIIAPKEGIAGILSASTILIAYGVAVWFAPRTLNQLAPSILSNAMLFGLIAGAIFATEIVLEYIILPKDNSIMGLVEFGSVFFLYFLASLVTAFRTKSIRNGVLSAIGTALIATLIWTIVTLSVFYLFHGSSRQELIFQAEGNYSDFAQSRMTDFNTFIVEDFMGAVFFHSLLSPIVAALVGLVAGLVGRAATASRKKRE